MNKEKGITLIALIITIIVLLILAGISISLVAGDNGILNKSDKAKIKTEQAAILEELRVKMYDKKTEDIKNEILSIDYLKTAGYVANEFEEGNETCYVINPNRLNPIPSTGKGNIDRGDIYYLKTGDLYYLDTQKDSTNLGGVYRDTIVISDDIFEYEDENKTIIIGIRPEFKEVKYYDKYKDREVNIVKDGKTVVEIIIPSRVVKISEYVFDDCINIEKVTIPENVKEIGRYAFCRCISLIEVEYKGNKDSIIFGEGVFRYTPLDGEDFIEHTDEKGTYIETDNPYENDMLMKYIKTIPGAEEITLEFSDDCNLESGCDFITIYDKNNNQVYSSYGEDNTELANKIIVVKGDTIKLKFITDGSIVYRGFRCYIKY